eukprot:219707-Prorocentrum_lima.AAC.1
MHGCPRLALVLMLARDIRCAASSGRWLYKRVMSNCSRNQHVSASGHCWCCGRRRAFACALASIHSARRRCACAGQHAPTSHSTAAAASMARSVGSVVAPG